MYVCICIYIYICIHIDKHVYIYIYIYIYGLGVLESWMVKYAVRDSNFCSKLASERPVFSSWLVVYQLLVQWGPRPQVVGGG